MTMACNNCLQEILAGEPFWEDETEGTAYHQNCRQAALDRRNKAEDERAALIARAEAAEAEAARLKEAGRMVQEEVTAWRDSYEALNEQRLALAARVAELEAALSIALVTGDGLVALSKTLEEATRWRPVTEEPDEYNWYITVDDEAAAREDGTPPYAVQFYDGEWVGRVDGWRPIHTERPPLDAEPTP